MSPFNLPKDWPEESRKLNEEELLSGQAFINGQDYSSKSGKSFDVVDPCTAIAFISVTDCDEEDVDKAIESAHERFQSERKVSPHVRSTRLLAWFQAIQDSKDDLAKILTAETGKPLKESYLEIDYGSSFLYWFAGEAERIHGTTTRGALAGRRIFTIKSPIGVVGAMCPWNFPIAMLLRKVGAAFAAGCTVVAKPSPETPLTTITLAKLALRVGYPNGCLNVVTCSTTNTPSVAESICKHPRIAKITFTGSTPVGKLLAQHCSHGLKKLTLELGGNAPYIIFNDASLDLALSALMTLKWRHAGQACITANRVYVQSGVYDKFTQLLIARLNQDMKQGLGIDPKTTLGPLTTPRAVEKASKHVDNAVSKGANIALGGHPNKNADGYFYPPTVLTGMTDEMLMFEEETFAPIAGLFAFETEDEVVERANNTSMGLASYFFTRDVDRTFRLLDNLEAGMIGMNTGNSSAAEAPFGGIKQSGYGREAGFQIAVDEYCVLKTGTLSVESHF